MFVFLFSFAFISAQDCANYGSFSQNTSVNLIETCE